eukprot:TRINITY_DN10699_c0_g1_i2.p1 TRINITY_DN10699_c0_g1~~TRINITY_DN10699_c0_g1_i2.p1  ORF type:complete len:126 (+),score=9.31 TRINITY_DN10699_c0_g1_i2:307-684(+)
MKVVPALLICLVICAMADAQRPGKRPNFGPCNTCLKRVGAYWCTEACATPRNPRCCDCVNEHARKCRQSCTCFTKERANFDYNSAIIPNRPLEKTTHKNERISSRFSILLSFPFPSIVKHEYCIT